ncbi:MAG: proton-conducting transporter membrane subunit [Candidatus Neomarinimicrobiota bacterium]
MINLLVLFIAVPLAISVINLFFPVVIRKALTFLGSVFLLFLCYQIYIKSPADFSMYDRLVFSMDKLGFFTLIFSQALSFIILVFSLKGVDKEIQSSFFILFPMTVAFCNGAILAVHSVVLMIFWGLTGITLYLFALLGKTNDTPKTAKKTFIIVGGSDVFLILGLLLIGFLEPSSKMSLWNTHLILSGELAITAFFCLLIASFAKAGGFPLHTWVPDFSKDSPIESAALLPASLDKLLGIYLLARMMLSLYAVPVWINYLLITLGALTVITAVMMAMIQNNGRKFLGYSTVSQVGYMIMGVGSGSIIAFIGGLFHMINHVIYKSTLFLSLGSVEKKTGTSNLDDLGGLAKKMPLTFIAALIGALSISGIPPLNGFFSKWLVYQGMFEVIAGASKGAQVWLLVCLVLAVFGSALTLASFMKFLHAIYLGKRPKSLDGVTEAPVNQWIATLSLALGCVVFGLFAMPLPLKRLIFPILTQSGLAIPVFAGFYDPLLIFWLFGAAFLVGLLIYFATRRVRFDENYLGGMDAEEKFRITGTAFYNEIRQMSPLRSLYDWAERKYFDCYNLFSKGAIALANFFSSLHRGMLQMYNLWIVIGFLMLLIIAAVYR